MLRHTVVFRLRHPVGSAAERDFLTAAQRLAEIPGVTRFEVLRQVSPQCGFTLGLSMEFADSAAHARYGAHPDHETFVRERWIPEVVDFLEIDYTPYGPLE